MKINLKSILGNKPIPKEDQSIGNEELEFLPTKMDDHLSIDEHQIQNLP